MSIYGNNQFVVLTPTTTKPHVHNNLKSLILSFHPFSSSSSQMPVQQYNITTCRVRAASAAASSSVPLGTDSEEMFGVKPEQKTQRTSGMDQDEIDDPTLIADADSCFCEFNGVQLHHKISDPDSSQSLDGEIKRANFPMILLHGFGASVFSWNRVMKPLANIIRSKVVAFDRPAFGLTSRVEANDSTPLNPYSTMFSVLSTLYFVDFLAADKAILVGHSAGSNVVVDTYFEAPERIAALILVAPAILAPFATKNQGGTNNQNQAKSSGSNSSGNLLNKLSMFTRYVAQAILRMFKGMSVMINALYKRVLTAILRSTLGVMVVRMLIDKFGTAAVRSAWYDSKQVSDQVIQGYRKPLMVKGWDKALVEYTVAMLTDSAPKSKPPSAKRLSEISCPVLIVTGDTDRLVPAWNSERLSRAIPGSCLEIIKNCGHLPHEEKAEEFLSIVDKFLQRVFGAAEEPHLQAAT